MVTYFNLIWLIDFNLVDSRFESGFFSRCVQLSSSLSFLLFYSLIFRKKDRVYFAFEKAHLGKHRAASLLN